MLHIVLVLVVVLVLEGFGIEPVLMQTGPAEFTLRNFKPLGLTNLSRTTTRTSTMTIDGLPIAGSSDNN